MQPRTVISVPSITNRIIIQLFLIRMQRQRRPTKCTKCQHHRRRMSINIIIKASMAMGWCDKSTIQQLSISNLLIGKSSLLHKICTSLFFIKPEMFSIFMRERNKKTIFVISKYFSMNILHSAVFLCFNCFPKWPSWHHRVKFETLCLRFPFSCTASQQHSTHKKMRTLKRH